MNRTVVMKFRATEEEAAEIRRKAAAAGMNVSRFLRTAAVNSQVVLYNTADIFGLRSDIKKNRKQHQPNCHGGELKQVGVFV
ncbi:MAG: hypothetical protein L6V87_01660 [Ruminococcus sp.]|nr:MAG: hypothetical protein L6V87_01660 [Ruminococcus sp.]